MSKAPFLVLALTCVASACSAPRSGSSLAGDWDVYMGPSM
jgi:hypothetical protein